MRSYDRHAGVRAGTRPADGRFERLQRHRENIRRIARELNVDVSSGLVRGSRQGDDRTGSASMPPSAVQPKKTSLVEETSRPSTSKTNKLETSQPDLGEEIFDALQHYQPPKQTEETAVAPESSQGHSGQGAVSSSPAGAEGSPGPQTPSLPTATQTLTHTGSSVLEDAMAAGAAGASSAALAEAEIRPCRSCGHATPAGRFCQRCGQRLEANDPSSPAKEEGVASGQDAGEPVNVDETFGSILSRWRQQFADFQRALGDAPSPEDVAPTSFPLDGDPEAFVQRIKKELGIDAGPLAIEPAPEARTPEVELLSSDVLRQIQAMSASFAEAEDFKHFEPEVSLHEAEALNEPLEPEQVEAADVVVAGSPPLLAEEVLLSRLSALEAEVLKLRGESAARPFPELSESPRRPQGEKTEATEVEAVEAQQAMSSLGMSLLSPSSLFASISDGQEASPEHRDEKESEVQAEPEKIAATPEEMPASASASSKVPNLTADPEIKAELEEIEGILTQKSDAKFGEEEEKVEIEKTKTKESELNPRPITEPEAKRADEAGAFFVPFTALRPRKDTAVQVPEEAAAMQATQTVTLSTQELQEPKQKDDQKGSEDGSQLEQKAEQVETQMATMEEAEEEVPRRPATSPPQPAFVTKVSKPAVLPVLPPCGEAKPLPPEQGEAASFEKMHSEAGSGPLPSKTAGPPRPRSLPAPPKPSSPQRSGDVPWPKSPTGPYPPLHRQMFEGSPPMRWPELSRPAAFPPDSFLALDGLGMPGMPPVWQGAGGWHARDKGEEDLMLHRAYEVYRQQQLDLLRQ